MEQARPYSDLQPPASPEAAERRDFAARVQEKEDAPLQRLDSRHPMYLPLIDGHLIRLVELEPGDADAPVSLRLSIAELEHAPDYDAISYVWGNPDLCATVSCNGRLLDVTANLHAALVQVRESGGRRTLWADGICINQGSLRERSHHVAFMNLIYKSATSVFLCFGQDLEGRATDIVALIQEHNLRREGYDSVAQMPTLAIDDPIFGDPRWKSLGVLMKHPWFTRAWVVQEAGVARNPQILYGHLQFSYRDLMKLIRWIVSCASNLMFRAGIDYFTIHIDWEDWSPQWQADTGDSNYTLLDFLSHAKGLSCRDPKDHIYAFLGHPLAQLEDGSGPIIIPDYEKDTAEVFLELTSRLLQSFGFRVLSWVEHIESTLMEDYPSWINRWDVELAKNGFGLYPGFYYRASSNINIGPFIAIEAKTLMLKGIVVDVVSKTYQFSTTSEDLETPEAIRLLKPTNHQPVSLDRIWQDIHLDDTPCIYANDEQLDAFSLTLCGGLTNFERAEDKLGRHRANFAAYWKLRLRSTSFSEIPATLEKEEGQGDEERFWLDMSLCSEGRSFVITQKGYYGLGPWIAKPGDVCCIFLGCRVPFLLREANQTPYYKLVGEAYIHGLMEGEWFEKQAQNSVNAKSFCIC